MRLTRRLVARLRGEVSAADLEALRAAGLEAHDLVLALDERRSGDPWALPRHHQIADLCAWCAYALQTLADRVIEADYAAKPATIGYLPRATAASVRAALGEVSEWLSRARQAEANPSYALDVFVPRALPRLIAGRATRAELVALREAAATLQAHTILRLTAVDEYTTPGREAQLARLKQMQAAAASALEYAERLWRRDMPDAVLPVVAAQVLSALEQLYLAGQLLAMPSLLDDAPVEESMPAVPPLPGEPGFDQWRLTDPQQAGRLRVAFHSAHQLAELWERDPDPARTLAIQTEIDRALEQGHVQRLPPGSTQLAELTRRCPWPPAYVALETVDIAGTHIDAFHPFTLVVGEEQGRFRRALVVAPRPRIPHTAAMTVLARGRGEEPPLVVAPPRGPDPGWSPWDLLNPFDVFDL